MIAGVMPQPREFSQVLHATGKVGWLQAADAQADGSSPRRFRMLAYSGGVLMQPWSDIPIVVDLAGLTTPERPMPVLRGHSDSRIVGHTTEITNDLRQLNLDGIISGAGEDAKEVAASAANGFPWQASIGVAITRAEEVGVGETVEVNGQSFTGPLLIARAGNLFETSFVTIGADKRSDATLVAHHHHHQHQDPKGCEMKHKIIMAQFVALCAAHPDLSEQLAEKVEIVEAESDETKAGEQTLRAWAESQSAPPTPPTPPDPGVSEQAIQEYRQRMSIEASRVASVTKLTASHPDLQAKAIADGWSPEKAELEVLRASRQQSAPGVITGGTGGTSMPQVLEAAAVMSGRGMTADLEKQYGDQVLEAADRRFRGRIGAGEMLLEAAHINGYVSSYANPIRNDLQGVLRAAFSTRDISGILSNVANKFLLAGFSAVEDAWRMIAATRAVNDFKQVTSYRMTGDMSFEQLAPDGEIRHANIADESYTNQADTYAKMLAVTRQDLINDDLGALTSAPRRLGRGGAIKLNKVFWTEFEADAGTFWTSDRGNYFSGASTNLQISSLTTAVQKFRDQTDPDGDPLSLAPRKLLVPTALEVTAQNLFSGANIVVGALGSTTSKSIQPDVNPHAGRYQPVVSAYLSNATAWWLLADPEDLATIEVAFLNGQESPTVEQADADFNTLGIQMRGYFDFGVNKQEYRAGVKSKGAA